MKDTALEKKRRIAFAAGLFVGIVEGVFFCWLASIVG